MRFTLNLLAFVPAILASALIPTIDERVDEEAPKSGVLELGTGPLYALLSLLAFLGTC
jgi:hypothetical protein